MQWKNSRIKLNFTWRNRSICVISWPLAIVVNNICHTKCQTRYSFPWKVKCLGSQFWKWNIQFQTSDKCCKAHKIYFFLAGKLTFWCSFLALFVCLFMVPCTPQCISLFLLITALLLCPKTWNPWLKTQITSLETPSTWPEVLNSKFQSFEDQVKSFEFQGTVKLHFTGTDVLIDPLRSKIVIESIYEHVHYTYSKQYGDIFIKNFQEEHLLVLGWLCGQMFCKAA